MAWKNRHTPENEDVMRALKPVLSGYIIYYHYYYANCHIEKVFDFQFAGGGTLRSIYLG